MTASALEGYASLFTERGGEVLDAVFDEAIRICGLAGAARADKITGAVAADDVIKRAALDYLCRIRALRVVDPGIVSAEHRVYVLV